MPEFIRQRGDPAAPRRLVACTAAALAIHAAAVSLLWTERAAPTPPPVTAIELQIAAADPPEPPAAIPEPSPAPEPPPTSPEPPPPPALPPVETPPPVAAPLPAAPPPPPPPPPVTRSRPANTAPRHPPREAPSQTDAHPSTLPSTPQPSTAPPAPEPAPNPAAPPGDPNAIPTWQRRLVGDLQSAKRYPDSARQAGDQGSATVGFTLDRAGQVLAVRLVHSSGSPALDDEAVALIRRVSPLPPPPPELPGATVTLTVPIRFSLR